MKRGDVVVDAVGGWGYMGRGERDIRPPALLAGGQISK